MGSSPGTGLETARPGQASQCSKTRSDAGRLAVAGAPAVPLAKGHPSAALGLTVLVASLLLRRDEVPPQNILGLTSEQKLDP